MKKNRLFISMLLTAVSVGSLVSGAKGATISVNYETASSTVPLASGDVAGVVPVANWNNVTVTVPAPGSLVDDSGAATSLGVAVSTGNVQSWNTLGNPDQRLYGDKMVMGSAPQTLTLTNVPYSSYEVIIYLSDWGSEVVTFSLDGGSTIAATVSNTFNPIFGSIRFQENNTHAHLRGLSGNTTITMDATAGELHIAGFQIVAIPEPSAALLGGLGLLVLLRRRRA